MIEYRLEKLLDLEYYTEGPAIDREGNLFFTTLTGQKILQWLPGDGGRVWADGDCPNGQVIMSNGEHWFCESRTGCISAYHSDGSFKAKIIDGQCAGFSFSTPNDLITDTEGSLFFTNSVRKEGKVFMVTSDGRERLIAGGIDYANGLALNPSGDILYVAESYGNRVLAFPLTEEAGNNTGHRILIDLPSHSSGDPLKNLPDGLAADLEGRIWVAHYGMQAIQVISPEGVLLHTIDTGLPLTSNLAFIKDTPGKKELLVTGGYAEPGPGAALILTVDF